MAGRTADRGGMVQGVRSRRDPATGRKKATGRPHEPAAGASCSPVRPHLGSRPRPQLLWGWSLRGGRVVLGPLLPESTPVCFSLSPVASLPGALGQQPPDQDAAEGRAPDRASR